MPAYRDLSQEEKAEFLQYDVSVRDLGSVKKSEIIEVFKRINSTHYSLEDIEINNAVYSGKLKAFASGLAERDFFSEHGVFRRSDYKRMGDLKYTLLIIITMMSGYFNRDDEFENFLSRYNDDYDAADEISKRFDRVIEFVDECGFESADRIWRKADLFTVIAELDRALNVSEISLAPHNVVDRLQHFFGQIADASATHGDIAGIYYKAALQASNDRVNRVRRGIIIQGILVGTPDSTILNDLKQERLV